MKHTLLIEGVSKTYGSIEALKDINLTVPMGEFTCFVGPSGCGKTTLLRLIAGFDKPTRGRILLDGRDITALPPQERELGMVFQSLALFPHMSVGENISYGLKRKGMPLAERQRRVEDLLALTHLSGMASRPVTSLSGGQRQRVAVARALAVQPKLFLLDEPFSALDARLRDKMQVELRDLQRRLRITTLFVTHDQAEAMMLADTIAVFSQGRLQQVGKPGEVYGSPATPFVADFLGAANIIPGEVAGDGTVHALGAVFPAIAGCDGGSRLTLAIRAEDLRLEPAEGDVPISGRLHLARNLGAYRELLVDCAGGITLRCQSTAALHGLGTAGDPVVLYVDPNAVSVFSAETALGPIDGALCGRPATALDRQ